MKAKLKKKKLKDNLVTLQLHSFLLNVLKSFIHTHKTRKLSTQQSNYYFIYLLIFFSII